MWRSTFNPGRNYNQPHGSKVGAFAEPADKLQNPLMAWHPQHGLKLDSSGCPLQDMIDHVPAGTKAPSVWDHIVKAENLQRLSFSHLDKDGARIRLSTGLFLLQTTRAKEPVTAARHALRMLCFPHDHPAYIVMLSTR